MEPTSLPCCRVASPIGVLELMATSAGLCRVRILPPGQSAASGCGRLPAGADSAAERHLQAAASQLAEYFAGRRRRFQLSCDLGVLSPFRRAVLRALAEVEFGATLSYAALAARAGRPGAARAVGSVMACNPLPLIYPCHRVLTAAGGLGGYSGGDGPVTKRWLLNFEEDA